MLSLLRPRAILSLLVFTLPVACVIKLQDKNAPALNGDVTGPAANCKTTQALPKGAVDANAPAAYKFVGRFLFPEGFDPNAPVPPVPAGVLATEGVSSDFSGNNITVRFEGTTKVTVHLKLDNGSVPQDQLYEFILDDQPFTRQITVVHDAKDAPTNTPQENYEVTGLSTKPHELTIWKNSEVQKGNVLFKGFDLHEGHALPPRKRPRKMEVIGDSIMCGYGIEGQNATCPFEITIRKGQEPGADGKLIDVTIPVTENQFLSFTSQTAQKLDADITTICWSGKGVYLNYKENTRTDPTGFYAPAADAKTTVPDVWANRTLGNNTTDFPWDFTKEKPEDLPQVVVISLGTNDFSRDTEPPPKDATSLPGDNQPDGTLDRPGELEKFYAAYLSLVTQVRLHRPDAHIFVATPPMLTDEFPIPNARSKMRSVLYRLVAERKNGGDTKVYAMDLVEMGFRYGLGCDYHPNLRVHEIMTEQLVGAIKTKTCWN